MRLMVLFDLPVVSKEERKIYSRFRRFLLKDGYDMVQFSVYARICNGQDSVNKHITRLSTNLPEKGSIRYMQVTVRISELSDHRFRFYPITDFGIIRSPISVYRSPISVNPIT